MRRTLLLIFLVTLVAAIAGFYAILRSQAMQEAEARSEILLSSATSIRTYTDTRILPALGGGTGDVFHEEIVPSFAAQSVFRSVSESATGYKYREVALNPTNTNDRADAFEVGLIRRFIDDPKLPELSGFRSEGAAWMFYLARPLRIDDAACLSCHDTPSRAPAAMLTKYGSANGFGWKLHEVVGTQVLSIPVTQQFKGMFQLLMLLAAALFVVAGAAYVALTIALDGVLVRPLRALRQAAAAAARGEDVSLPTGGVAEVRGLATAIDLLRTSLAKALARLEPSDDEKSTK